MRSQKCEVPATFQTNNTQFHINFLPQNIRSLKGQSEQTVGILQCQYWANTCYQNHIDRAYATFTGKYRPD